MLKGEISMISSRFKICSYVIVSVLFTICFGFILYICLQSENSNEMTFRIPQAVKDYDKNDPCAGIYAQVPYYNQMNKKERVYDVLQYCDTIIQHNPNIIAAKEELGIDFAARRDFYKESAENCKNDFEFFCTMQGIVADLTGKYEYIDFHMIDTFVPEWTDHYINKNAVLQKTAAERRGFVKRTSRVFKNLSEFIPQYYDIYKNNSYIFTYAQPNEYVCSNEGNPYTYWTLTEINSKPISDFVIEQHLFGSKLRFDENKNFYRQSLCFNETKGEPVTLTLKSPDGEVLTKDMFIDITAEFAYKYGKIFSSNEKYKMIYEFSERGDNFILPLYHIDAENNFTYIRIQNLNYKTVYTLESNMDKIMANDNIIIDLRGCSAGFEDAVFNKFFPLFNDKDGHLKFSYSLRKDTCEQFEIGERLGVTSTKDTGVYSEDDTKQYMSYDITSKGNPQMPDKNIYYLIDETIGEFSEQYINMIKNDRLATVIGRQSLGDGLQNHEAGFTLKYSGLIISTNIFESTNPDGSSNNVYGVSPDITVSLSREHFDKITNLVKNGKVPETFEEIAEFDDILLRAIEEVKKHPRETEV